MDMVHVHVHHIWIMYYMCATCPVPSDQRERYVRAENRDTLPTIYKYPIAY